MVDHATSRGVWAPGWNSYEATFRYTDDQNITKYYGGGGPMENTPEEILDGVCSLVAWCYYTAESVRKNIGANTLCNPPGPLRWWKTKRQGWPPSTLDQEILP